ncbi:unknown [Leyella stercorea CAG:629]|uniref:Uncharacterized protein n=1 Tax=Leyella stercorea CAG:629 TaxID=1263103 RepID=R7H1Q1_9BACT|nr:unknown [Leyella stercorea CAG:629]
MGVAHRHERAVERARTDGEHSANRLVILLGHTKRRCKHIHRYALHLGFRGLVANKMQLQKLHARECLQTYRCLVGEPALIEILSDATRSIAAHLRFRTISVKDAHGEVGINTTIRFADKHKSVATDACVAVAPCDGSRRRVGHVVLLRVNVDVVVACSMHLCKSYRLCHFAYPFTLKRNLDSPMIITSAKLQLFTQIRIN